MGGGLPRRQRRVPVPRPSADNARARRFRPPCASRPSPPPKQVVFDWGIKDINKKYTMGDMVSRDVIFSASVVDREWD